MTFNFKLTTLLINGVIITLILLSTFVFSSEKNPKLLFGSVNHPQIKPYETLIRNTYEAMGYQVTFIESPFERLYKSINSDLIDGIVGGFKSKNNTPANLLRFKMPIADVHIYLLCRKENVCTQEQSP